ncbi:MAG: hypothetical protein IT381_06895 [Deltaproteobacteria bacterium]|nr:hypothetical protein [Deltaproteobacteria bacterium]
MRRISVARRVAKIINAPPLGKNALCGKTCKTDAECAADAECFDIEDWDGSKLGRSCYPASGSCATGGTTGKTGTTGATGTTGTNTCTTQTWASVTPSFATYCSGCHQWAKTYTGVQGKGAKISARLNNDSMPPPAKPQPTASEQAAIVEWVDCGLPQ